MCKCGSLLLPLHLLFASGAVAAGPFMNSTVHHEVMALPADTVGLLSGKENTRTVGSVLAVFLGPFGAHRLYLGTNAKVAIIYGITFGGFGILPLLDLGHLLFTEDLQPYRDNNKVFMWQKASSTPP